MRSGCWQRFRWDYACRERSGCRHGTQEDESLSQVAEDAHEAAEARSGALRVVIAGAGVAGLEALLALRALAGDRVRIELIAPTDRFVHRPLLVAEPFGVSEVATVELAPLVAEARAVHRRDAMVAVQAAQRTLLTAGGDTVAYDALLVAPGARAVSSVPGALTFAGEAERRTFADVLSTLGRRGVSRIAFVIPQEATWTIAAYELALLTAAERDARRIDGLEIVLVTGEASPLGVFGRGASARVAAKLDQAGVILRTEAQAVGFSGGEIELAGGGSIATDRVVALPGLEVPVLHGLPQREGGFVLTDAGMHVAGLDDVWAAGDATSFPIKQGGLAAQQADVAARSIAARAGAHVPLQPFQPVLRAALITGGAPEFLRSRLSGGAEPEAVAGRALWWPPAKVAGSYLAPYLAGETPAERSTLLVDLEGPADAAGEEAEHREAVALLLAAAEADAEAGEFETALSWLSLIEHFDLAIPAAYVTRRDEWRRALDPAAEHGAAAKRLDPSFDSAAAALSDLQRRLGWLRATESREEGEMRGDLEHLDEGMRDLKRMSHAAGIG